MSSTKLNKLDVEVGIEINGQRITKEELCELLQTLAYHRALDVAVFLDDGPCICLDVAHVVVNGSAIQIGTEKAVDVVVREDK